MVATTSNIAPMTPEEAKAIRDILEFYIEAGVDSVLGDEPVDRFADAGEASVSNLVAESEASARSIVQTERPALSGFAKPEPPEAAAPLSPDAATMAARDAAQEASSLPALRGILERFEGCALRTTASRLVFADGNPQARLMLVGEAPGREEDIEGLPFVGRSGQLLNKMLAAIGLDRSQVYVTNIVPWRPPGNRTPTPQESAICLPFIVRQIELVAPDVLVCLGGPAAQALLPIREGIMKTRGRWFDYQAGSRSLRAMATLHPAYLLRQPLHKRLAWRDFLAIKKALDA